MIRKIQKTDTAAVFKTISERYPDLKNYKYHPGRSNSDGKMVYSFDYNSDTKELIKQNF